MLRIPWTARRTNSSVLKSSRVLSRIIRFFGHVIRSNENNLCGLIVQGKIKGKDSRGRSPSRWIHQEKSCTGHPLQENICNSVDRIKWHRVVQQNCGWKKSRPFHREPNNEEEGDSMAACLSSQLFGCFST